MEKVISSHHKTLGWVGNQLMIRQLKNSVVTQQIFLDEDELCELLKEASKKVDHSQYLVIETTISQTSGKRRFTHHWCNDWNSAVDTVRNIVRNKQEANDWNELKEFVKVVRYVDLVPLNHLISYEDIPDDEPESSIEDISTEVMEEDDDLGNG